MNKQIVIDLETKRTFDEVGGREHLDKLEVTVVGVYDFAEDEYLIFEERELGKLQNLLISASLVIGFNHVGFDFPVLQPYLSIDVASLPVLDIMLDFQKNLGHRIGLESVALATLGVGKTGSGIDAIRFYREGKMRELKDYCLNDVRVTREIFDYGATNGKIFYLSRMGNVKKEFLVDWGKYKKPKSRAPLHVPPAQYKLF